MRIAVVGAGLSGLVAARALAERHHVTVFDKGRSVGGRLATRRIGDGMIDHGAQFFTVRGAELQSQVDNWLDRGIARIWNHGFPGREDGFPRYIGTKGMNSLAKDIAVGLDYRTNHFVFAVRESADRSEGHWEVVIDDGSVQKTDAVILTCPGRQSWALLAPADLGLPSELFESDFKRTLALLVTLDRPSLVPQPGGLQFDPDDPDVAFGFIADCQHKGVSPIPAVVFHASAPWSVEHWDDGLPSIQSAMLERAAPWLGDATITEAQVKKWRFAGPSGIWPERCFHDAERQLVLAGDAFAGPKFEGAYNSGLAAAAAIDPAA
jgi:renalase